ncbi:MAG: MvaI/BcnI family restriction endonuclease [Sphingobacteriales bacterium]
MTLENLKQAFLDHGCEKVYVKSLAANDLSKSQVYLGGNYDILNIFPLSDILPNADGKRKRESFIATLNFAWITEEGTICYAPHAKFILYPDYPEVRFSGFLKACKNAPSAIMNEKLTGRLLFLGVSRDGRTLGFASMPDSEIANEIRCLHLEEYGVFRVLELKPIVDHRLLLLAELLRIHRLGWIDSKRLNKASEILPCPSPNCGGLTLEAELGIVPNSYSEPDYLGYEIKQFKVNNFDKIANEVITLMTPEPNGGLYVEKGIDPFIRLYGYPDKSGIVDRLNFGGVHKFGIRQPLTGLTLHLVGFDQASSKIIKADGSISLIDDSGNEASKWSFITLLKHWTKKHNQACYVPSKSIISPTKQYQYGNNILIGNGTEFDLFLRQMAMGNVYYDPGVKMEQASSKPLIKRRSQFRIKSGNLKSLYKKSETINLLTI